MQIFALPLRVGKLLVSDLILPNAVFRCVDHAGAPRECKPMSFGIAKSGRKAVINCGVVEGLRDGLGFCPCHKAEFVSQENVSRAVVSFRRYALNQSVFRKYELSL